MYLCVNARTDSIRYLSVDLSLLALGRDSNLELLFSCII
jgi:hypothetical protein